MDKTIKRFDRIWVTQPSHDFSELSRHADEIKFFTSGYERTFDQSVDSVMKNIGQFIPETDAIVVVGKVNVVLAIGMCLATQFAGKDITLGIYRKDKPYQWKTISL